MAPAPAPDGPLPELKHPAPEWFRWAISRPVASRRIEFRGGHTHYLKWSATGAISSETRKKCATRICS